MRISDLSSDVCSSDLLVHMAGLVDGFDVASGGELKMALAGGMAAEHISFAGPGKRDRELEAAIMAGVMLNIQSAGAAVRAPSIAGRHGVAPLLAVRGSEDSRVRNEGVSTLGYPWWALPTAIKSRKNCRFLFTSTITVQLSNI